MDVNTLFHIQSQERPGKEEEEKKATPVVGKETSAIETHKGLSAALLEDREGKESGRHGRGDRLEHQEQEEDDTTEEGREMVGAVDEGHTNFQTGLVSGERQKETEDEQVAPDDTAARTAGKLRRWCFDTVIMNPPFGARNAGKSSSPLFPHSLAIFLFFSFVFPCLQLQCYFSPCCTASYKQKLEFKVVFSFLFFFLSFLSFLSFAYCFISLLLLSTPCVSTLVVVYIRH